MSLARSRANLIVLQVLVAVLAIGLWHVLTATNVLPPFFFSTPLDVFSRVVKWLAEGTIWRHLWVTLVESVLANARMLGMSERQLMRHVYWPSALSWMFSSLHTSVGFAVVGAVVGEYLGSAAGLGYLIQQAEGVFDVAGVFAGMFVLAVFVLAIDGLVSAVERRLLVWRPLAAETRT